VSDRSIKVSYYAVWHFLEHEGITFKKACTPVRRIALCLEDRVPFAKRGRQSAHPQHRFGEAAVIISAAPRIRQLT
jgi:hypothetical protein